MIYAEQNTGLEIILVTPMEHVGDVGLVESSFGPLETVLVSVQDSCTVCTKHTIGSEIILDAPSDTSR
jgi:hypothetical protein